MLIIECTFANINIMLVKKNYSKKIMKNTYSKNVAGKSSSKYYYNSNIVWTKSILVIIFINKRFVNETFNQVRITLDYI